MKNSHARNHPAVSEQIGMETYRNVKQADYTKEAEVYDLKRFSHVAGRFYAELSNQIIFDLLEAKEGDRILDLATGTGRVSVGMAEKGVSIFGADLTWKMVERARKRQPRKDLRMCRSIWPMGCSFPIKRIPLIRSFRFASFISSLRDAEGDPSRGPPCLKAGRNVYRRIQQPLCRTFPLGMASRSSRNLAASGQELFQG